MTVNINHPAARRYWSAMLEKSAFQHSFLLNSPLLKRVKPGDSIPPDAVFVMEDTLMPQGNKVSSGNKGAGYRVDFDLEGPLFGYPVAGDNAITGGAKLSLFQDTMQINQNRFPVDTDGEFAQGLVPYEELERIRERLTNQFWPHYWDERLLAKASGALGSGTWKTIDATKPTSSARDVNGSVASDGNDLRAPSSGRIIYGNGRAGQSTITTSDYATLDILDDALMRGFRAQPNATLARTMPTLMINRRRAAVWLVDYVQAEQLGSKTNERFYDLKRAEIMGGKGNAGNVIDLAQFVYRSPLGIDVYIVPHEGLVRFSAAVTGGEKVVRSLLLGRGAMRIALGRKTKTVGAFSWYQRELNEGNQTRVTSGVTEGIQKAAYLTTETGSTREDWAVMAIDTYGDY